MWHVTCLGGWTFSQNFSSLALTVCDLWYYEDLEEKDDSMNEWISDKAVYRTAPATPGLLTSGLNPGNAITPGQHGLLLSWPKGSLVPCADTFRDKLLLDGSQSREHKGPAPSFNTTTESMHSAHSSLLNIPWVGLACHDIGSLLYTSRGHANSQTRCSWGCSTNTCVINNLTDSPFVKISSTHLHSQTVRARKLVVNLVSGV